MFCTDDPAICMVRYLPLVRTVCFGEKWSNLGTTVRISLFSEMGDFCSIISSQLTRIQVP